MKILTFTTLYPNREKPGHGIFVETRLRHLVATEAVEARVVAPVPWFPFQNGAFGRYATFAKVPHCETRSGLQILHPRYPALPKIGMSLAPFFLAQAAKSTIKRMIDSGYDFDVIDAHYFYPDGVAAVMLGRYFNKPTIVTARGSDVSLLPQYLLPRKQILWAAKNAAGIICVCEALKKQLVEMGVAVEKIVALRNGVDLELFRPVDRVTTRRALGVEGFMILSVGNLVPVKGHELTIEAIAKLPDVTLMIAGDGPERKNLEILARSLGVQKRVVFLGSISQNQLRNYYSAADVFVLSSSREGWANVLLESMACGTPVIASNVWGTPEVVAKNEAGLLLPERTAEAIAHAVRTYQKHFPDRSATRRYAESFSWRDTSRGQIEVFKKVLKKETLTYAH